MATDQGATVKEMNLSSTTLFVRNLPFVFDNKELEKVFSEVGPVKRCFVVKDKANQNKCRGFGYVTFALKEDAVQAQEKIRQINGRKLFITFSNKKPRHVPRGPSQKKTDEPKDSDNEDNKNAEDIPMETIPSTQQPEKTKHKPKSKRSSAMNNDGRTVVLTGFPSTFNMKQLKKACKKNGEIEQFIYPVETDQQPTAHAVYKSHKDARKAVDNLNGKTVKGQVLDAILRSKMDKNLSQKSLKKSRLIVRNLPFKCSKELLNNEFSKFGKISEIVLPTKTVGKNKKKLGFAFVQFKNVFDAAKALEGTNKKEIKGRPIAVDWTLPKKKYELMKVSEDASKDDENEHDVQPENSAEEIGDQESEDDGSDGDDGEDDLGGGDHGGDDDDSSDGGNDNEDGHVDGDSSDGNHGDDDVSDEESPKKKKRKLRDAREGKTIFIRNLPFDATEEEICDMFEKFGEVAYCKIVVDSVTDHSRGSAFVKFQEKQSADDCLEKYGDENEGSEELVMRKRPISVALAVTKGKVPQLLAEKDTTKKAPRDKRNLYLAKEGVIMPGSDAAVGLTKSDLQKRQKAEEEKKAKLKMPHYIVSQTRLCFRNLPLHIDDKKLSGVLRTVCDGKPKTVRKVKIMRSTERLDSSGVGRSKGFGFAEFVTHQDALEVLRVTNNNPEIFGPDRRPIVEFAIENSLILQRLEQRKTKNMQKIMPRESNREMNITEKKRKRERNGNRKTRRVKKGEDENGDNLIETVRSNANSSNKSPQNSNVFEAKRGLKNKQTKQARKSKESLGSKSTSENNTAIVNSKGSNSRARKIKNKADKEEEEFNQIVEKYKSKLFGENTKQLKASRWFDA